MTLAKEHGALLLIDEEKGRIAAEQHAVETLTTAGVLLYLVRKKAAIPIDLFRENLAKYARDSWFSLELYQKCLNEGEKNE
ncbi:MAG: hypothetical protein JW839_14005 [Candidatus Lokiarchaeota archaeon]|nr:hypothetical protein [Candidatus Lokiarchaeota archaeon]